MKTTLKGIMMLVLVFIATSIQTNGYPANILGWEVLGITLLGTVLIYVIQSIKLPTTSEPGTMNWLDIGKGGIIAIGNMLATFTAAGITGTHIDYKALFGTVMTILVGYFIKQLASVPTGIPPSK